MFQDRNRRLFEFGNQIRGRANVENVIEGEFLAMKLFEIFVKITVKSGALVWVFSVSQAHRQRKRKRKRGVSCLLFVQETADRAIIIGRPRKGFNGEALP